MKEQIGGKKMLRVFDQLLDFKSKIQGRNYLKCKLERCVLQDLNQL